MATSMMNHLLSHQLSTNESTVSSIDSILKTLHLNQLISNTPQDVLHRWQLRLTSLINSSNSQSVRTAGFRLLHQTYTSSDSIFLSTAKQTLTQTVSILSTPISKIDTNCFKAAVELTKLIVVKSTWYPEWARENVGAQLVQKIVSLLVQTTTNSQIEEIKLSSLSTICTLIPLFPTALRPLSPSLHSLSLSLICEPTSSTLLDSASRLFSSLYLLAPKGKEGLKEAWKTGVEALVGTIDLLVSKLTENIFAEDMMTNHSLSPLSLPPSTSISPTSSPHETLSLIERLSKVLLIVLRSPTTEKAGPVQVPVGSLVELGTRIVGFNTEMPIKERIDPHLITSIYSYLPRLQIVGCQLIAQLAITCGGSCLTVYSTLVLGCLARSLSTYQVRSPMRPVFSTTYSIVVSSGSIGSRLDPEESTKSLARVWRTVLEDISSIVLEPISVVTNNNEKGNKTTGSGTGGGNGSGNGRKNKRIKTSYDPSESMVEQRAKVDERDLEIAEKGLATLQRLIQSPCSHFLPPSLQLSTSQLLLYISLSPSFFSLSPLSPHQTPTFYPPTSASQPLEISKQSPQFRLLVVESLLRLIENGIGGSGTFERSLQVWVQGSLDSDSEVKRVSQLGLRWFEEVVHPKLPVQLENETLLRQRVEKSGGMVGDGEVWREGIEEFRRKDFVQMGDHDEDDDEEGEEGEGDEEDQVMNESSTSSSSKRKISSPKEVSSTTIDFNGPESTATNLNNGFSTSTTATTTTKTSQGFSSFTAPSFGTAAVPASSFIGGDDTTSTKVVESKTATPPPAPVLSFSTETFNTRKNTEPSSTATTKPTTTRNAGGGGGGDDDESDSDDEMMPAIDMGSDGE